MLVYSQNMFTAPQHQCLGIRIRSQHICLTLLSLFFDQQVPSSWRTPLPLSFSMIADVTMIHQQPARIKG